MLLRAHPRKRLTTGAIHKDLKVIQWNLSITDTLGPDIFGHFLLRYRGFPLSEVKSVLVTPFGTKIFVLIMEVFSIESLIRMVC